MAKYKRMINCEFVNAVSFKMKISNKAKLLYFYMLCNSDDVGFVANTEELTAILKINDSDFESQNEPITLIENTYENALNELIERGYLYAFEDSYQNKVYLIRHWFLHNTIANGRITPSNYEKYLNDVSFDDDNIYVKANDCNTSALQVLYNCNTNDKQVSAYSKVKYNKVKYSNVKNSKVIDDDINNKKDSNASVELNEKNSIWTEERVSKAVALCQKNRDELTDEELELVQQWEDYLFEEEGKEKF